MYKYICLLFGLLILSPSFCGCTETTTIDATLWEVVDNTNDEPDQPDETLGDIVPIASLNNPDRGLHVEVDYLLHNLKEPWADVYFPDGFVDPKIDIHRAQNDGLTLTQMYIYLTEYVKSDIPQSALDDLQRMFDKLKEGGYKAILRFAYKTDGEGTTSGEESPEWVERHLEQLTPILNKNLGLIAVMQAGFVGTWGEWHSSPMDNNQAAKNRVVNALLKAYPYCIEMRHPRYKTALTLENEADRNRIGFANDYFTVGEHRLSPDNDFVYGDPAYVELTNESHQYYVSGEIPYSGATDWEFNTIMPIEKVVVALRDHHYSAFDISQNFDLNILSWKNKKVYPQWLDRNQILYADNYFKDEEGNTVVRSFYDFVRDHLGYRLNLLEESTLSVEGQNLIYNLQLTNTGFSTLLNPRPVYLVFINESDGVEKEIKLEDVDPKNWQPFEPGTRNHEALIHKMEGRINVGLSGKYRVGIWMPDGSETLKYNSAYGVKWALNTKITHWIDNENKYVVNVIGEVEF
ncbi:DUF4874 domain-containing protein [Bacteroides congonensis]